jgi:hypothetical protein
MATNLDRFKKDLDRLDALGDQMSIDLESRMWSAKDKADPKLAEALKKIEGSFTKNYQRWYSEASSVIRQLLPDRLAEFVYLYHGDPKRKAINADNYHIQDWLNGTRAANNPYTGEQYYNDFAIVSMKFKTQLQILRSVHGRFESSLFDMAQLVRADLFDSEVDAARELLAHGFSRAAGAVAGVVIERHLAQVCATHAVAIRKKDPSISDFNDQLKAAAVVDVPAWRQIQRLADIRNLCDHNKQREPTKDEVSELIDGTDKLCKTLF